MNRSLPFGQFVFSQYERYLFYYWVFALFWVLAFLQACNYFIIASATCIWYFAQGNRAEGGGIEPPPIRTSVKRLVMYHCGSIAFGSFILAFIWSIKTIMAYTAVQQRC